MARVRGDLEAFAAEVFDGFFRADQRRWGQAYARARLVWKDGDASARVSRQYTGTVGKVTDYQVRVSLHLARDHVSAAVNRWPFPPSWDPASLDADWDKVARHTRCSIPDRVGHMEK